MTRSILSRFAARAVPALPWIALIISLSAGGFAAIDLFARSAANRTIAELADGRDASVSSDAPPAVLFARAHFLLSRDRIDEAQPFVGDLQAAAPPRLQAAALYTMANARMRLALTLVESAQLDKAIPQLHLAREHYRKALRLDPALWDARYNLDVVMRMARDFPEIELDGDSETPAAPKRLLTDLPGLPKGLP